MISMMGVLGLDTRPFVRAIRGVKSAVKPAGAEIGREFSSTFMRYVGLRDFIGLTKDMFKKAADIKKGATKVGVSSDEYQQLQRVSEQTGVSIESMTEDILLNADASEEMKESLKAAMKEAEDLGGVIASDDIEKLTQAWEKLTALFGRLAPLVATVTTGLIHAYDFGAKMVEGAVGDVYAAVGQVMGDKEMQQAGEEISKEVFGDAKGFDAVKNVWKSTADSPDEHTKIDKFGEKMSKIQRQKKPAKGEQEKSFEDKGFKTDVDSMRKIGGYIRGSPLTENKETPAVKVLREIYKKVASMSSSLDKQLKA